MSDEATIVCPNCSTEIKLTESLAAPLIKATRQEYERKIAESEKQMLDREDKLKQQQAAVARAEKEIEKQVSEQLEKQRKEIAAQEAEKAKRLLAADLDAKSVELDELQGILKERDKKLADAQRVQAEFLKKQRVLEDEKRELDLTIEKRVQETLTQAREQAKQEAEESLKLRVAEKEEQIASMQRKIEELKKKAEQGSQQLQGEAQEIELEETLRNRFPLDSIEPVGKGEFGGDILQRVMSVNGSTCGTILWESKRTKNWNESWLAKLRDDQRSAGAEIAILVSHALPKHVDSFDQIDTTWVSAPRYAIPLVIALRQLLIEVGNTRLARQGQQSKMEMVYEYLTGPRFRHRIEAIVEKFSAMQSDLEKEKRATRKMWAKREMQIQGVIESTVGMYGDLQGIAGQALKEIDGLELPLLEEGVTEE